MMRRRRETQRPASGGAPMLTVSFHTATPLKERRKISGAMFSGQDEA